MSAPAAASSAAAASSSAAPAAAPVQVDADPIMDDQFQDQKQRSAEIQQLRDLLKDFNKENADQEQVKDLESSDRVAWKFLKARKFDVSKAADMFREVVAFRKQHDLDHLLSKPCPKGLAYKTLSRHGFHGYDRFGRPVYIKNVGLQHFPSLFSVGTLEERMAYTTYLGEWLRQVVLPEANARIGHSRVVDQTCIIVNLKNFGFHCIKQFNYQWVKAYAAQNSLLYPESAGHCWIINAPRVFSMVWNIVKGWVDERSRNKVKIFSDSGEKELRAVLGDEFYASLPKEIGGQCECMPPDQVPPHASGCMLAHPMNRAFVQHLEARDRAAGVDPTLGLHSRESSLKDQEEDHAEDEQAATGEQH